MSNFEPSARKLFIPFATGCVGLGGVGLIFRDFALQWQPVPAGLPFYQSLALASALLLITGGAMLWFVKTRTVAATILAIYFATWMLVLHLPRVLMAPTNVSMWLGLSEIGALAAGALAIAGEARQSRTMLVAARILLGACAIVFGASHFTYAAFTATMVPKWIPAPVFWAYATGTGHTLAGLALLSGIRSRIAALALAAMCGAFVVLLHLPRVIATPSSHAEWTMLCMALLIAGAALATAAAPERRATAVRDKKVSN
ncbi:MAG: DoxX family protein [Sphingomonadaceae bacterium]|nr:DoxX family protein [Sphingomonadaceae bacterium]